MLYSGLGSGTSGDPYQVATADQLDEVRSYSGAGVYWIQTANISLADYQTGTGWVSLPGDTVTDIFEGEYDGNGYTVSDIYSETGTLFGRNSGTIKNVHIPNGTMLESGISLQNRTTGVIEYCYVGTVQGGPTITSSASGFGIAKSLDTSGTIRYCFFNGTILSDGYAGGITITAPITECIAMGSISGVDEVGGLDTRGSANHNGPTDSVSYANLYRTSGSGPIGSASGYLRAGGAGNMTRTIGAGTVNIVPASDTTYVGALVGYYYSGTINDCFWLDSTYATSPVGTDLTDAELKVSTNLTNFDFDDIWIMATQSNLNSLFGEEIGVPAYAALPADIKDKPWLRSLTYILAYGITPAGGTNPLFFGGGI